MNTNNKFQMQPTITIKEVRSYLQNKKPFRWGSSTAMYDEISLVDLKPVSVYDDNDDYILTSYATVIARVNKENELVYFDDDYYSNTTRRFQNMIKEIFLK